MSMAALRSGFAFNAKAQALITNGMVVSLNAGRGIIRLTGLTHGFECGDVGIIKVCDTGNRRPRFVHFEAIVLRIFGIFSIWTGPQLS